MSEEALIFEVSESGFDRYVIENSHDDRHPLEHAVSQRTRAGSGLSATVGEFT